MNISEEIYANISQVTIPRESAKRTARMWTFRNSEGWVIYTIRGPSFFWNDDVNDWLISLKAENKPTAYATLEQAFEKAKTLPSLD